MKWFKHISDSLTDPFISDLIKKFGPKGYLIFFGTLEIMAREFDVRSPGDCTVSFDYLKRMLRQYHRQSLLNVLDFFSDRGRIYYSLNGDYITLKCPKLKDLCDEYTKKQLAQKSGQSPDSVGILSPLEGEVEGEVDL